jgi:hypothetical protein
MIFDIDLSGTVFADQILTLRQQQPPLLMLKKFGLGQAVYSVMLALVVGRTSSSQLQWPR